MVNNVRLKISLACDFGIISVKVKVLPLLLQRLQNTFSCALEPEESTCLHPALDWLSGKGLFKDQLIVCLCTTSFSLFCMQTCSWNTSVETCPTPCPCWTGRPRRAGSLRLLGASIYSPTHCYALSFYTVLGCCSVSQSISQLVSLLVSSIQRSWPIRSLWFCMTERTEKEEDLRILWVGFEPEQLQNKE